MSQQPLSPFNRISAELFLFAFAVAFACYMLRAAYEWAKPMLWLLCPMAVLVALSAGFWWYLRWRNSYWG
jgi:hypothetical protein